MAQTTGATPSKDSNPASPLPIREPGVTYPGDSRYRRPGARPQPAPAGGSR